ncbi:MAG: tetratricopeptide repeat protein [Pseudomonadota bacterium]
MRQSVIRAGIVAATLTFGVQSAAAQSQPGLEVEPLPDQSEQEQSGAGGSEQGQPEAGAAPTEGPAQDAEASAPAADLSEDDARAQHLDELFALLADPDLDNWERVQAQIWQAWARSGSPSMDLLAQRADKAIEEQRLDTALLHLNDLVRLAPEYSEGWNKRATLHFMRGDYGPSLDDIAETLKREPRHFGALSGLGIILDRIGDEAGALEAYRRAVRIHPHLPGAQEGIKKLEKEVEGQRL